MSLICPSRLRNLHFQPRFSQWLTPASQPVFMSRPCLSHVGRGVTVAPVGRQVGPDSQSTYTNLDRSSPNEKEPSLRWAWKHSRQSKIHHPLDVYQVLLCHTRRR